MKNQISRTLLVFLCGISSVVLGASYYFQYVEDMQPCPLCLMQRLCVFLLLCIGLAMFWREQKRSISTLLTVFIFVSLAGLYFSTRQLWLMSLPADQVPSCMPGLEVLIKYFSWQSVVKTLLWGTGDCAESTWRLLGFSMPAWTACYFSGMAVMGLWFHFNKAR